MDYKLGKGHSMLRLYYWWRFILEITNILFSPFIQFFLYLKFTVERNFRTRGVIQFGLAKGSNSLGSYRHTVDLIYLVFAT